MTAAREPRVRLAASVTALTGLGPKRAAALASAGVASLRDLVFHLPRAWEDRRTVIPVAAMREEVPALLRVRVAAVRARRLPGRRRLIEADLTDESGTVTAVWFNQRHLPDRLARDAELFVWGRPARRRTGGALYLAHPDWEPVAGSRASGRLLPVYPELGGIASERLRRWIEEGLDRVDLASELPDRLPPSLRERHGLPTLSEALLTLHRPPADADAAALATGDTPAQHRLVYGELFLQQLALARRRRDERSRRKPHAVRVDDRVRARARAALPFRLTAAQRAALKEIVEDLRRPWPMRRLLQGDVGSGKTIVAALAMLVAAESGLQAALLAPTELLAEQHAGSLRRVFGPDRELALVTASHRNPEVLARLADGTVRLAVGTHALLEDPVRFRSLALAVVDEQHRFGVGQREALRAKGADPDLLVMSATPIPRSLALTLYGDLDVSVIDALPPGRRPVETVVVAAGRRREVYARLRRTLADGGQGYVVFPRIDEGEEGGGAALGGLGAAIRERFGGIAGVLHGRLDAAERDRVVERFRAGEIRLLLATTVIEVGVDVPSATALVVESAERFGLAQLHQLRGRVGRGTAPSWCAAIHGPVGEEGRQRLAAFAAHRDGFAIAEADLRLRGPGDLLGDRQAGLPPLRFAALPRDLGWLLRAREDAAALLAPATGAPPG